MGKAMRMMLSAVLLAVICAAAPAAFADVLQEQTYAINDVVASDFFAPAPDEQQGSVVRVDYTTRNYASAGLDPVEKAVFVYLPAGYDSAEGRDAYDVFYFMHGWTGTAHELFDFSASQPHSIKNMLDRMIAAGRIPPMIVVAATWNIDPGVPTSGTSVWSAAPGRTEQFRVFHEDFENDLMPAIESRFRTYAGLAPDERAVADGDGESVYGESDDGSEGEGEGEGVAPLEADETVRAALAASRDHRGFGGFSYGGFTTWWQFYHDIDYISAFAPMSAGLQDSSMYERLAGYADRSYELCCVTGTADATRGQCDAVMTRMLADSAFDGHVSYYKLPGGQHTFEGYRQYLYTALQVLYGPDDYVGGVQGAIASSGGAGSGGSSGTRPSGDATEPAPAPEPDPGLDSEVDPDEGADADEPDDSPADGPIPSDPLPPLADVRPGTWYAQAVETVRAAGLMQGVSADAFGVGRSLTRGQLATMLWRRACPDEAQGYDAASAADETGMAGVADGRFYTAAANWAVAAGVVNGMVRSDGTRDFAADAPVTLEQFAAIVANYAQADGADGRALAAMTDADAVSAWARPALAWACETGVVNGYEAPDGSRELRPKEVVSRERAAALLANALDAGVV